MEVSCKYSLKEIEMASEGTSPISWKQHYQAALLETDPGKLPRRIADAHTAINLRIKELSSDPSCEEYSSLVSALRFLCILEKEASGQRETT